MTNHKNDKRYRYDLRNIIVELYHSGHSVKDLRREYRIYDAELIKEENRDGPRL